jgi:hypothetical protein
MHIVTGYLANRDGAPALLKRQNDDVTFFHTVQECVDLPGPIPEPMLTSVYVPLA